MTTKKIEEFLHTQIPISKAMDVRVLLANEKQVILSTPLAINHNHMGTAFGGS